MDIFSLTYRNRYNWKNAADAPRAVRHASKEGQGEELDHSTPNLALNLEFRLFPPITPFLGSPPTLLVALEVESWLPLLSPKLGPNLDGGKSKFVSRPRAESFLKKRVLSFLLRPFSFFIMSPSLSSSASDVGKES